MEEDEVEDDEDVDVEIGALLLDEEALVDELEEDSFSDVGAEVEDALVLLEHPIMLKANKGRINRLIFFMF